ncbi:hypothetical protein IM717_11360 [Bacillus velezensis]|uniref:hypothetical protein n=1 Tax=Bacillus velezensis TaxID=492670 RepID=UPI001BCEE2FA|nr:hypothetical protein [Bacillus velezensis]MBS4740592.1 hypothetical protein [Bacillus velezensis]
MAVSAADPAAVMAVSAADPAAVMAVSAADPAAVMAVSAADPAAVMAVSAADSAAAMAVSAAGRNIPPAAGTYFDMAALSIAYDIPPCLSLSFCYICMNSALVMCFRRF